MKSHILLLFAAAILLSLGAAQDTIENPAKPLSINAGRVVTLKEEMRIEDTGDDFYFKNPFTILTCERLQDNLQRLKLVRAAGAGGACGRKVHSRAGTMLGGRSLLMLLPRHKIDTRRRTRLILINGPKKFPTFYGDFIRSWQERDRYQEIELYYTNDRIPITISPVPE
jgi:hypothetical protein